MSTKLLQHHCPRDLEAYPTKACPLALAAIESLKHGGSDEHPGMCPWHVPDSSVHHCYWALLDREAPVEDGEILKKAEAAEDPKRRMAEEKRELNTSAARIGQMLDIPKKEVLKLLESGVEKLRNLDQSIVREWLGCIEETTRPADHTIYCQLFEQTEEYNPEKREDYDPDVDYNPEDWQIDFRRKEMFVTYDKDGNQILEEDESGKEAPIDPTKPRRGRPPKTVIRGFSSSAAQHYKGKRTQLYGLSDNWKKNAQKFADAGTPIVMCQYTLHAEPVKKKDKKDAKKSEKST